MFRPSRDDMNGATRQAYLASSARLANAVAASCMNRDSMESGSCLSLLAPVLARRGSLSREWRENRRSVLASAVLSPGAYLLVLFAFQLSKAGYVVAGREVSIVISALMGSLWMKEGALGQRLLGAGVVASGVICVAFAR